MVKNQGARKMVEVVYRVKPILSPLGEVKIEPIKMPKRLDTLRGKTIALVDNQKPNADVLLKELKNLLSAEGVKEFKYFLTPTAGPASKEVYEEIAKTDAAIGAVCDCGSCTAWVILKSIEIERRGVPTVSICSAAFASLGAAVAEANGAKNLQIVKVDHPVAGQPVEVIVERARKIKDEVIRRLTQPIEVLVREGR
jgi:hypothetical protein